MNAEAIFHKAVEISDASERAAYVAEACRGNPELQAEVEALLKAHEQAGDFLEASPASVTLDQRDKIDGPGTTIGRYQLLELIGEGGMGLVYLAEQKEPVKRRVAFKIIKPGMDSRQVIARFEAERQALAVLDHPNIAHVFDAGCTETGRPYFVMEHVKGMSITRYCDENKLDIEQRLRLFEQVCEAVHHAHQKGIIHRDLKPSNILVSVHGDRATPKIIDFGIAKAITSPLTDKTFVTYQGQLLGTPEYMSPEQVDLATQDIDTRSDIYSLGVVLYELLAGVLPFESEFFARAGLAEIQQTIREQEPASPSIRLTNLGEQAKTIAASRSTQVVPLARRLHRELEWIPLKAMRKDRCRRYRSASEMADDIRNYLTGLPLLAGPETTIYRVQKFVTKHAGSVATIALVAVAIVLGLVVSTAMYFKAEKAHQKEVIARADAEDARGKEAGARGRAEGAEKVATEKAESYRRLSYNYGIALADATYREADIAGVRRLLKDSPADLRGWEWQRLDYISDEALMTLRGDGWSAFSAGACSPDGKLIAAGGWTATIRVWDLAKGEQLRLLRGHAEYITCLQFSPDGRYIASGSADRTVRVWDVASGETVMTFGGHDDTVWSVAFSPDGRQIASGSDDDTARIWSVETGAELRVIRGYKDGVSSISFSPDGRRIAAAGWEGVIRLWDVATGELAASYGQDEKAAVVAFSLDGHRIISAGKDGVLKVRDSASGTELTTMRGHSGWISQVAFSPDGRRAVSCGDDNTVRTWDTETGVELRVLRGHEKSVTFALFTPDGSRIVSGGDDSTIKVWDPYIDHSKAVLYGHRDCVSGLVFTPDNKRLVSGSWDGTIKIWDVASGAEIQTLHKHEGGIASVALSPDGKLVASGGRDNTVRIWDIPEGEERMVLRGHKGKILSIAFSPDGKHIVSGSQDGTVKVWDVVKGDELMNVRDYYGPVTSVAISPDGRLMASGGDGDVLVWDSVTGKEIMELSAHSKFVSYLAFSHDGKRMVSGSVDAAMKVWDVATGNELMNLQGHSGRITSATFTQDGARLISSSLNGRIKVWDPATGQGLTVMERNIAIPCGALSPDERTFATGCADGSIVLWQRTAPSEGYGPRQTAEKARAVVEQLHSEQGLYHRVIDKLNSDTTLTTRVRQVALQIANSHRWEDADQLTEKSWEAVRPSEGGIEKYQAALEQAREANHLEPNNRSVLRTLGIAQYRVGAYDEAIKTLMEAEKVRNAKGMGADLADIAFTAMSYYRLEQAANARISMAKLRDLFENGQYDDSDMARDVLIEAERLLVGENAELRGVWDDIRLGNIDAAARKMDELRSLQETKTANRIEGAVKYLGRAYCRRAGERLNIISEYASKIADYESAVHFDPNRAASLNDLAWLRATCPVSSHRDAIRAVELATKACELASWQNHEYIGTLSAAYSEMGDFNSAIRWQEKAASLLPRDCPTVLRVNYEARLGVYQSRKPYHKGSLWSFSDGELVAHWKFDDINAAQVLDSSGHGLHGRFVGDAHVISDPERGNVLSLDGDGDYVQFKEDPAFDITGAVTMAAWIQARKSEIDRDWTVLTGGALWFHRSLGTSGVRITGMFTGSTSWDKRWFDVSGNIDVSDGKWHHVVGVHDGSKFSLYVDGILDDFQERGGIMISSHSPFYIGGYPFTKEVWNGLIDDVRIYSYAMSPEEVKMLYEGKEPPRERRSE